LTIDHFSRARHSTSDVLNTEPHNSEDAQRTQRGEPFKPQLLVHDTTPTALGLLPREYQKKKPGNALDHVPTHDHLFNETPVPWNPER
jgi:hypothetical protein